MSAADDKEWAQIVADHIRFLQVVLYEHRTGEDVVLWPALLVRAFREIEPVVHLVADPSLT